jgi:cell division protein FtsZ
MVDEKLDDQVWVTVVATGYGNGSTPPRVRARNGAEERAPLPEPSGEPRVSRVRERSSGSVSDLDVPEFMPRR